MSAHNNVMVKDYQHVRGEAIANAAITPGHFIYRLSTDKVAVHASAGQNVTPKMVALEDELQGNAIGTAYASAALVQYAVCGPGDWVNTLLKDGETIVKGDAVESAGDGTVQKYAADTWAEAVGADSSGAIASGTIYPENIIGIAREALDLSDSSGADPASFRLLVEIV